MTSTAWYIIHSARYHLSEHPAIVSFRWSHTESYGSTWSFLFTSIALYLLAAAALHVVLIPFRCRPTASLRHVSAAHSLLMSLISLTIFAGTLLSAAADIRDARWWWRGRSKSTPIQWLFCFPLGTRPSGRVFFWSYAYYLSRFLHALRPFISIVQYRQLPSFKLLNHSVSIFMSFLWLEFSQSFQVLAILLTTLVYSVEYGYRFWTAVGFPGACFPFVVSCQMVLLSCNLICHVGVLTMHYLIKGGCNGIGAWCFNSVLNGANLLLFLHLFVKMHLKKRRRVVVVVVEEKVKDRDI